MLQVVLTIGMVMVITEKEIEIWSISYSKITDKRKKHMCRTYNERTRLLIIMMAIMTSHP